MKYALIFDTDPSAVVYRRYQVACTRVLARLNQHSLLPMAEKKFRVLPFERLQREDLLGSATTTSLAERTVLATVVTIILSARVMLRSMCRFLNPDASATVTGT